MNTYESPLQAALARDLAAALTAHGFVVTEGDYDLRRTVELGGVGGNYMVVVPLHQFFEYEAESSDADDWLLMMRAADGTLVEAPDAGEPGEAPFGCPSIWDVTAPGHNLEEGVDTVVRHVESLTAHGFVPVRGVLPATPASQFQVHPYPGARPAGSWVVYRDLLWPVLPDSAAASGWSVIDDGAACLDEWLARHGGTPLASRVPVLSYGSNGSPLKFIANGVQLPGVNIQAQVHDLAAVYCRSTRGRDGAVPATLAAMPGHSESHVVSYVTPEDFRALDGVEGRAGRWYELVALASGNVILCNGMEPELVLAYVGGRRERHPQRTSAGGFLLVDRTSQEEALAAQQAQQGEVDEPVSIGVVWPLEIPVTNEVAAVFVYGTLMPGQLRWTSLEPYMADVPEGAHVTGALHDTGHGFPALFPGSDMVPGYLVHLHPSTRAEALEALDAIEGTDSGLFARDIVSVSGAPAWLYRGLDEALRGPRIAAWAAGM